MKLLRRNTTAFEYLPHTGEETDLNEAGEHTGEFYPEMGEAVSYRGSISDESGNAHQAFYGQDLRYTHTLLMDKPDVDIREDGLIRWKGNTYEILAIRRSLNVFAAALRRQSVNYEEDAAPEEPEVPDEPDEPEGGEDPTDGEGGEEP